MATSEVAVPQQERSRLSTHRLLQAAAELIAERGYEKTTLAAIGERAGYSHGLVTRRFGSKDALLIALVDRMTVEWSERELSPAMGNAIGVDGIRVMIDAIRAAVRRDPAGLRALYALMFEALVPISSLQERMRLLHFQQREALEDTLREAAKQGALRAGIDPAQVAQLVVSALRGAAYQWLLDSEFDFDGTLAALGDHLEWMRQL